MRGTMTAENDEIPPPSGPTPPSSPGSTPRAPVSPSLAASHGSWTRILLEVALITLGVFLALMVDQWRERADHRQLAEDVLRRFHTEFTTNRAAVAAVRPKHENALAGIQAYFGASPAERATMKYPYFSTDPAFLEYTAWDLAIATQALAYVDPDIAQQVAHVYAVQRQLDGATRDITLVMYTRAGDADPVPLTRSLATYFGDCTLIEPRLLALYDEILPRLDARLRAVD
jgi:hypothetical protein